MASVLGATAACSLVFIRTARYSLTRSLTRSLTHSPQTTLDRYCDQDSATHYPVSTTSPDSTSFRSTLYSFNCTIPLTSPHRTCARVFRHGERQAALPEPCARQLSLRRCLQVQSWRYAVFEESSAEESSTEESSAVPSLCKGQMSLWFQLSILTRHHRGRVAPRESQR